MTSHGPEACREIFAFGGAEIELHLFHLKVRARPVVHDHEAEDVLVGFGGWDVAAFLADHDGDFELEIEFVVRELLNGRSPGPVTAR